MSWNRGYKIIESSFESSFELVDFLLDEMTQGFGFTDRVRDRVRVRVTRLGLYFIELIYQPI